MLCDICGVEAWYVCGRSGRPLCPQHSRIEIVSRLSFGSSAGLTVRESTESDLDYISKLAEYFRYGSKVTRFGKEYDIQSLPAYIVSSNEHISGALSYALEPESLVIVMMDVLPGYQGLGAGKMLLDEAKSKAEQEGKSSILVTAANDDLPSIYFYQRNGFRIYEVVPDAIAQRNGGVKVGFGGISSQDEIHLRWEPKIST